MSATIRRVYGRGFYDGMQKGVAMAGKVLADKERGLSSVAHKVLDVVPLNEGWTLDQILVELRRLGRQAEHRATQGCLGYLKDEGLIRELADHKFIRVEIRRKERASLVEVPKLTFDREPAPMPVAQKEDFMTRMGALSEHLRALAEAANGIANQVDEIAIEAQQEIEASAAAAGKLEQFRALLKGL